MNANKVWASGLALILIMIAIILVMVANNGPGCVWHMVNVGQGDAHLIQCGDRHTLIDAGMPVEGLNILSPYIKALGIKKIDTAVLTHPHLDHYGGFHALIHDGISIDNFYHLPVPENVEDCCFRPAHYAKKLGQIKSSGTTIHEAKVGDVIGLGQDARFKIIYANNAVVIDGNNNDLNGMSIVGKLIIGKLTALLVGDINTVAGNHLAKTKSTALKSEILKSPHHGGKGIPDLPFFDATSPRTMLVSGKAKGSVWCDERGKFQREWTTQNGIKTYVTGLHGHVVVNINKDGEYNIQTERSGEGC